MRLKVKDVKLSTGGPLIAILNEEDAKKLDLHALDKVQLKRIRAKEEIHANLDISSEGIETGEIGLFKETLEKLGVKEGTHIELNPMKQPSSLVAIRKKLEGQELSKEEIEDIIHDIGNNELSEVEMTYFMAASYTRGLSLQESAYLTLAISSYSSHLNLKSKIIVDKHCAGGVPNNRTSMLIVPIVAAAGLIIPKTSSRAITSPAGTADTMEVLAPVKLPLEKIVKTIKATNGCIIWESSVNPSGADDKLIKIRHPMSLDPEGILLASIMAKKKAVSATHVLVDLPYGEGAKFRTKRDAKKLGSKFVKIGKLLNIKIKIILTDGSQPVGNGIGPALEAKDVLSVLKGDGPNDLREKAIHMATLILNMGGIKKAKEKVIDILDSGRAYQKMIDIICAQGGSKHIKIPSAKHYYDMQSKVSGKVIKIHNKDIAKVARVAGAPRYLAAGIYLRVKKGFNIKKGDILFTIYAENQSKLDYAKEIAKENPPITIK